MLRVTTLNAGPAAATARYYTKCLTQAPGEQPGVWSGAQAAELGLSGEVSTDALEQLLSGCDPLTGVALGNPLVGDPAQNDWRDAHVPGNLSRRTEGGWA